MWFTETPLVWHHGWSLTHWHGLAGHDVVSGLHLPLPILWGPPHSLGSTAVWFIGLAGHDEVSSPLL